MDSQAISPKNSGQPDIAEKYGIDVDYDFRETGYLPEGAVAATVKAERPRIYRLESFEDFLESDSIAVLDGELVGVETEEEIGLIRDMDVYPMLDSKTKEYVDLHEHQHLIQYSKEHQWGDYLDRIYDLSEDMQSQLNFVDRLMDVKEDPILGNLVSDAEVTALVEGYTEKVTETMHENGEAIGEDFYPGYTQLADYLLEDVHGIDVEEEFSDLHE